MTHLLLSIAVFLILMGVAAVTIGAARHFFPTLEPLVPDSFKRPLSFSFGSYYLLAGLLLILLLG
ncbi:hypothetical protein [Thiolinea disciformis]|uniref:hypothetical protein n=1 Tax=Thiolinea disciformis TaxID=125614 RepID=UPI00038040A1|nr:hypothetical protein [Thiolinea disciformis]